MTERIRVFVVKLLRKIADEIEWTGDDCYAWVSYIGEALKPIVRLNKYLTDASVEELCELMDYVEEGNWGSIKEQIGDNIERRC